MKPFLILTLAAYILCGSCRHRTGDGTPTVSPEGGFPSDTTPVLPVWTMQVAPEAVAGKHGKETLRTFRKLKRKGIGFVQNTIMISK